MADRALAQKIAIQKYQEAGQWWEAFDKAVAVYRCWAVRYLQRKYRRRHTRNESEARMLTRMVDEAHDMVLLHAESIWSAARCAVAAELAGRIYYDEYEERETGGTR